MTPHKWLRMPLFLRPGAGKYGTISAPPPRSWRVSPYLGRSARAALCALLTLLLFSFDLPAQSLPGCKGPEDLEHTLAVRPSASAWNALGAWFGSQNQLPCAIGAFESALRLAPGSWESHYDLGLALLNEGDAQGKSQGNTERAALELRKASRLRPGTAQIHAALGAALNQLHQTDAAIAEFRTVLRSDPKSVAALDGLSKALIVQKKYSEAVALLRNAPDEEPLQLDLAVAYSGEANTDVAAQILSSLLAKDPANLQAQINLGLVFAGASRYDEAEEALRKAAVLSPDNPSVLTPLAMVLSRLDRKDEAIEYLRKVCAFEPSSPDAHLNLGIALADKVQLNNALDEFSETIRLAPGMAAAHYNKGRLLLDMQRNKEAKPELEVSLRADPNLAGSWYLLGLIAMQAVVDDEAVGDFRKVIVLEPRNPEAHYMLGREMLNTGDRAGAIAEWRKTIEIQPNYGEALYNLSRVLAKSDPQESSLLESRLKDTKAQQRVMDRAQMLGNFALASANAHDWPHAISQLKEALTVCGECTALSRLHKDLGLIYCRSGDFRDGRAELLAAQKLSPDDEEIRKSLQLIPPE
jgi:tetratricopeptide (TPR) repeat protein